MTVESFHIKRTGSHAAFYLGKKDARPDAVKLKLEDYLDLPAIVVPPVFGFHNNTIDWKMLGNSVCGDCVVAGAAHETMLWSRSVGGVRLMTQFDEICIIDEYKSASGWNGIPNDESDTGLDMAAYAKHRRDVGLRDAKGNLHRISAYARIRGTEDIIKAIYVFGAVGIGIQFPRSASIQFDNQQPWDYAANSTVLGGHYIAGTGRNSRGQIVCITWARLQGMTTRFMDHYVDEALAYISPEFIDQATHQTPRHFDLARLQRDLAALAA